MPVQRAEELLERLQKRKWHGSSTRLNIAEGPETYIHKSGRKMLVTPVLTDVVKSGPISRLVQEQLPFVEQVTLNKNLKCTKHRDRNEGDSFICFLGDFERGGLYVEEPTEVRHLLEKGVWHQLEELDLKKRKIKILKKRKLRIKRLLEK